MRNFYYILIIICCSFILACNSVDPDFPHEEVLDEKLMPLQGITNPLRVDINLKDSIFHIYDLVSQDLKSTFGRMGEGPDEFILPWLIQSQLSDIYIGDKHMFYRFSLNKEGQPMFCDVKEPKYVNAINEAAFISDSLFVVDAMYTGSNIYLLSLQDELPKKSWTYRNPDMKDYYSDPNMGRLYANQSRIIFCYGYKKQIDFMDIDFNLINSVKFKFNNPTFISSQNQGDVNVSYVYSYLGKRYLYSLFFGTSWNENRANFTRGIFLEVFDLEGKPVARYHLKGRRPVYFAVDEETFTLYGAGEDGEPEDYLLMYKLNGLL